MIVLMVVWFSLFIAFLCTGGELYEYGHGSYCQLLSEFPPVLEPSLSDGVSLYLLEQQVRLYTPCKVVTDHNYAGVKPQASLFQLLPYFCLKGWGGPWKHRLTSSMMWAIFKNACTCVDCLCTANVLLTHAELLPGLL